jgi:hypothetical protein
MVEAARALLAMRSLWLDGRIDIATLGPTDVGEREIFRVMADVYSAWLSTAAHAWRGYEVLGRGTLVLVSETRLLNYYQVAPNWLPTWLPSQTVHYCASYDPRTELVMAIYGFPHAGAPETTAALWIRPPDTWITPAESWQQLDQGTKDLINTALYDTIEASLSHLQDERQQKGLDPHSV